MAITHHLIVQICYREVKKESLLSDYWWDGYELLGDDIIIFDKLVAERYLRFMEEVGVPINLSKSVISNNGCIDFAKVTGYKGVDVSAIS